MDLKLRAFLMNVVSPVALRKGKKKNEKRDMFLRKSSNQNVFHMSVGRFVCICLFHGIFVSLIFYLTKLDHSLWLQVRLRATFLKVGEDAHVRDPFSKIAPVCLSFFARPPLVKSSLFFSNCFSLKLSVLLVGSGTERNCSLMRQEHVSLILQH